jgi:hypothetical protein
MAVDYLNMPPALQWREHHEQVGGAITLTLTIVPFWAASLRWDRHPRLGDELL